MIACGYMQFFLKLLTPAILSFNHSFRVGIWSFATFSDTLNFCPRKPYVVQVRNLHRDPRMESLKSKLMEERQEMVKALDEHHKKLRIFVPCLQMVFILHLSICLSIYLFDYLFFLFIHIAFVQTSKHEENPLSEANTNKVSRCFLRAFYFSSLVRVSLGTFRNMAK